MSYHQQKMTKYITYLYIKAKTFIKKCRNKYFNIGLSKEPQNHK